MFGKVRDYLKKKKKKLTRTKNKNMNNHSNILLISFSSYFYLSFFGGYAWKCILNTINKHKKYFENIFNK